jgi:Holliday junction resolvase RusA-like endonuclease
MSIDRFEFKGTPKAKPRMTRADSWKKRKCVVDYWAFKDEINRQAKEQGFKLGEAYRVEFHMPIPKSRRTGKKKVVDGQPHKQKPDKDNMEKAINDCLLGEDSGVWYNVSLKRWSDNPRIIIENFPDNLDF